MIIFISKIIIMLVVFFTGVIFLVYRNKFASKTQESFVRESIKLYGTKGKLDRPWILLLLKIMFIFWGLLFIIAAYPVAFGPY